MAIATLPTTNATAEIVYALDPDVTPKNGSKGWMLRTKAELKTNADVLEVRPLNIDERTASLDVDGLQRTHKKTSNRPVSYSLPDGGNLPAWLLHSKRHSGRRSATIATRIFRRGRRRRPNGGRLIGQVSAGT